MALPLMNALWKWPHLIFELGLSAEWPAMLNQLEGGILPLTDLASLHDDLPAIGFRQGCRSVSG